MDISHPAIAVIALNFTFGLFNVVLCRQLWRWRRACRVQRHYLQAAEQAVHTALTTTTSVLHTQRHTSRTWRSRMYHLQIYVHNLRQLLRLLALLQEWSVRLNWGKGQG